jgi:uncharacterized protein with ATP-grasp and redox domains
MNEMEEKTRATFNEMMAQLDNFLKEELQMNEIHKAVKGIVHGRIIQIDATTNNIANPWAQIMYHRFERVADAIYTGYSNVYMLQLVVERSIGETGSMDSLPSLVRPFYTCSS